MKKILQLLVLSISLFSCSMKEKIVFNEDMTGDYELSVDLSPMVSMAGSMMGDSDKKNEQKYDTIVYFDDIIESYKDSAETSYDKRKLENLRGLKMQTKMDIDSGDAFIRIYKSFNGIDDLNLMHENFDYAMDKSKKESKVKGVQENNSSIPQIGQKVTYSYKRKRFKRIAANKKTEETNESSEIEENDDDDKFGSMMNMIGKSMEYEIEYVFPRKIKKVSSDKAMISQDGKTLRISYDIEEVMKDPSIMSFEVKLK
ncbi:hypothetical protein [Aureivirga marina]|uniref:hypothetical protein n=1 Tax=Aureivirga marina TaxID=1182451 RepID=UPI0018C9E504|nr:hypothetical protein [Aureivirga marina]